jgi:hypothetical protein
MELRILRKRLRCLIRTFEAVFIKITDITSVKCSNIDRS